MKKSRKQRKIETAKRLSKENRMSNKLKSSMRQFCNLVKNIHALKKSIDSFSEELLQYKE